MNKNKVTAIYFVTRIISGLASLISVSIRSLYINPAQFGNYYLIIQFVGIFSVVLIGWISESCARYFDETKNLSHFYSTYLISLIVSVSVSLILIFAIGFFVDSGIVLDYVLYVIGVVVLTALHDFFIQVYRMSNRVISFSLIMILSAISNIVIFLILPKSWGISLLFLTTIIIYFAIDLFSILYLKVYKFFSFSSFSVPLFIKSIKYSLPLVFVWCSIWIYNSSNTFIINFFIGKEQIGYYNMANNITNQSLGILTTSLTFAVFPTLVSLWNKKLSIDLAREIGLSLSLLIKYMLPACFGLCSVSYFLFGTIINSTYNPNNEGVFLICIFALAMLIDCVYQLLVKIWNLEEKTHYIAFAGLSSAFLNILLNILVVFLTKNYLLTAFVNLFTISIRMIIVTILIYKKWKFKLRYKELVFSLLVSLLMGIIVFIYLKKLHLSLYSLASGVGLGALFFLGMMILLGQMKSEIKLLNKFFSR